MKNKKLLIGIILIGIILIIIIGIMVKNILDGGKSVNILLDKDNFLAAIEIDSKENFILVINEKEKVSNILFLNKESVEVLANKRIEGKSIEVAIKRITDLLKNANSFEANKDFRLISYGNSLVSSKVKEELNKQFVIYGVDKEITTSTTNFERKLESLSIKKQANDLASLEQLYYYSSELLEKSKK